MKIAVLSRNPRLYSTRRLVEAGQQRGHEMVVIDTLRAPPHQTNRRSPTSPVPNENRRAVAQPALVFHPPPG